MPNYYKTQFDDDSLMPPMIVIADLGNGNLKCRVFLALENGEIITREIIIPHGFLRLSTALWRREVDTVNGLSRMRSSKTETFKMRVKDEAGNVDWIPLQIGLNASLSTDNSPLLGNYKYVKGGIDALLIAAIRQAFPQDELPKGHNNIILGIGHPPTETSQVGLLRKSVGGSHVIEEPNGQKSKWDVRLTVPFDENIAGLVYMLSKGRIRNMNGQYIDSPLKAGQRLLVFDGGGRKGSVGWVKYNGGSKFEPDYNSFEAIDGGIITVRSALRKSLASELGVAEKDFPDDLIDAALKEKTLQVGGDEWLDISEHVRRSLNYLNHIRETIRRPDTNFAGGKFAGAIVATGGTTAMLYDEIREQFDNNNFLTTAPKDEIVFANERGGAIIVLSKLAKDKQLPLAFQKNAHELKIQESGD